MQIHISTIICIFLAAFSWIILAYGYYSERKGWTVCEMFASDTSTIKIASLISLPGSVIAAAYLAVWWSAIIVVVFGFFVALLLTNFLREYVQFMASIGLFVFWILGIVILAQTGVESSKVISMSPTLLAILMLVILCLILAVTLPKKRSIDLPTFTIQDITYEQRVAVFVTSFLGCDFQAQQLLNPSNRSIFGQGFRPMIGLPNDPESSGEKFTDILPYFIRKIYLDLNSIQPLNQAIFQLFVDQIGRYADQTLLCAGEIVAKYNLDVEGRFIFEMELGKIQSGADREKLKRCWLNDAFLGTELRMLAWIYHQIFGTPYINPEKR